MRVWSVDTRNSCLGTMLTSMHYSKTKACFQPRLANAHPCYSANVAACGWLFVMFAGDLVQWGTQWQWWQFTWFNAFSASDMLHMWWLYARDCYMPYSSSGVLTACFQWLLLGFWWCNGVQWWVEIWWERDEIPWWSWHCHRISLFVYAASDWHPGVHVQPSHEVRQENPLNLSI